MPGLPPRLFIVLGSLSWLLSACAASPPPPLYASLEATGDYGYYEEQLSDRRFRVGYDAAIETRYSGSRAERRREVDRKVAVAYDMALLRAAELAHQHGAEVFAIDARENNVRIEERDEYRGTPFLFDHPYWHHRYYAVPYYAYPDFVDRVTEISVQVSFTATFGRSAAEDTFDAGQVIERISRKYGIQRYPAR